MKQQNLDLSPENSESGVPAKFGRNGDFKFDNGNTIFPSKTNNNENCR